MKLPISITNVFLSKTLRIYFNAFWGYLCVKCIFHLKYEWVILTILNIQLNNDLIIAK